MKTMKTMKTSLAMVVVSIMIAGISCAGETTLGASITLPLDLRQSMKKGTFSLSVSYQGGGNTYNTYTQIDQSVSNATTNNNTTNQNTNYTDSHSVYSPTTTTVNQNNITNNTTSTYNNRNNYGNNSTYTNNTP